MARRGGRIATSFIPFVGAIYTRCVKGIKTGDAKIFARGGAFLAADAFTLGMASPIVAGMDLAVEAVCDISEILNDNTEFNDHNINAYAKRTTWMHVLGSNHYLKSNYDHNQ